MTYADIAANLKSEIEEIFEGTHIVNVKYDDDKSFVPALWVTFYGHNPKHGIKENSHTHMKFSFFSDDLEWHLLMKCYHMKEVRFRKFRGKGVDDPSPEKLVNWFKKNKDTIMKIHADEKLDI